MPKISP